MQPVYKNKNRKPRLVFVVGGPGSGKGTQCDLLVQNYGFHHLSSGDLLRDEVKSGSELGKEIDEIQKQGKSSKKMNIQVVTLLKRQIDELNSSGKDVFLIDGFPRQPDNLPEQNDILRPFIDEKVMLYFECREETMLKRILGRNSGRTDDNPASFQNRIAMFLKQYKQRKQDSLPIIEQWAKEKKIVRKIDAELSKESVQMEVKRILKMERIIKPRAKICFVVGCSGSGKSKICKEIATQFPQLVQLSTSELVRSEIKATEFFKSKSSTEVAQIIQKTIKKYNKKGTIFLINGFPRKIANFEAWKNELRHKTTIKKIIYIESSNQKILLKLNEKKILKPSFTNDIMERKLNDFTLQAIPFIEFLEKNTNLLHKLKAELGILPILHYLKSIFERKALTI